MADSKAQSLDCILTWNLQKGASKFRLRDVEKEVQRKIAIKNWLLPNQLLLCYIYSDPDHKDIAKMKTALEDARLCNTGESFNESACRWMIEACELYLKTPVDNARLLELQDEYAKICHCLGDHKAGSPCSNCDQLATIRALQAFCLVKFGPNGYEEASQLYAEANRFTADSNPVFLYQHAQLLAKMRRLKSIESKASSEEQRLWILAKKSLGVGPLNPEGECYSRHLDFLRRYVEAALNFDDKGAAAQETVIRVLENLDEFSVDYKVLIKFHKVCRVQKLEKEREKVNRLMLEVQSRSNPKDSQFYHTLSLDCNIRANAAAKLKDFVTEREELEKRKEFLLLGKKYACAPGHHYLELHLIETKIRLGELKTSEEIQDEYENLVSRFRNSDENLSTILVYQGFQLIKDAFCRSRFGLDSSTQNSELKLLEKGFLLLKKAVDLDSQCPQRVLRSQACFTAKNLRYAGKDGYLLWFNNTFCIQGTSRLSTEVLQEKYERFLDERLSSNEDHEANFVCLQLALLRLRNIGSNILSAAEETKRQLSRLEDKIQIDLESLFMLLEADLPSTAEEQKKLIEDISAHWKDLGYCEGWIEYSQNFSRWQKAAFKFIAQLTNGAALTLRVYQTSAAFELCARASLLAELAGKYGKAHENAREEMDKLIHKLLGIDANNGDDMRDHRLRATRLHLAGNEREAAVFVKHTLRTARDSLDHSCKIFYGQDSDVCFPFAFQMASTKEHFGVKIDRRLLELTPNESLDKNTFDSCFQAACGAKKFSMKRFYGSELYVLLRDREYDIFSREGIWLKRWIGFINAAKHGKGSVDQKPDRQEAIKNTVEDLDRLLRDDAKHFDKFPQMKCAHSAYNLAQRAAEFAETTHAWFRDAFKGKVKAKVKGATAATKNRRFNAAAPYDHAGH